MANIEFNAEKHEYRIDGRIVPSVTEVIGAVLPGWQADSFYLSRGRAMHHACHLADEGRLDWDSVHPEIAGRVRAWQKFREDFPAKVVASETPIGHRIYGFAGTLDRVLESYGELIICDLKSSIAAQVRLQLAAYRMLWSYGGPADAPMIHPMIRRAVAVELHDDAYKTLWMRPDELLRCEKQFLACLSVFNFIQEHNLRKDAE